MRKKAEEIKIRGGESAFIKGTRKRGGGNQSQEQTRSNGSIPVAAVFPWEKKLQDEEAAQHHAVRSAALLTHCIERVVLSP